MYKMILEKSLSWYIKQYGEKRGTKKFNNRLNVKVSLEYYFHIYGETEEALKKFNEDKWWHHKYETKEYNIWVYGETEGLKIYNEKIIRRKESNKRRGFSLKECIRRYGKEKGTEMFNKRIEQLKQQNTIERYITKYGEEEGPIKWKHYCESIAGSKKMFIKRYGEVEGIKRFNEFRKKCATNTEEWYINKYGDELGKEKYKEALEKRNVLNVEYYMNKGFSYDEACKKLADRQNTSSLSKFIKRYGEEEGTKRYNETNKLKAINLDTFIRKYGALGKIKYEEYLNSIKGKGSLEWYINKYGKNVGIEKYNIAVKNKLSAANSSPISNIGREFCNCLNDKLKENNIIFNDVFFNENEYAFIIKEKLNTSINIIKPDFYIKDINLCIEFYGDYWHGWLDSDTSLKRREFDKKRLNVLKYNYGCDTIIIWEHEYKKDKEKTINDLIIKIKDYARKFNN